MEEMEEFLFLRKRYSICKRLAYKQKVLEKLPLKEGLQRNFGCVIEVFHGSHVAWQEQLCFALERTFIPIGKRI